MSKKIFITRKIPDIGVKMLEGKGYMVDMNHTESIPTQKQIIRLIRRKPYDAVISLLTDRIDATVFDAVPGVKMYANYATGYDNIDLAAAAKRGISVSNAPSDLASEAVAEHAIALMLALAARIVEADAFVRRGKYRGWSPMNFIGTDILGKTLGLVGAGRIGARVAHYARGLGMKVLYYDVARREYLEKEPPAGEGAGFRASLEELLRESDVVSLHVPLLDSTRHLIDEARLRLMRPGSFLINTSRGPVVDERALETALRSGVIRGAGLDVFESEPKISRGLAKLGNVILTPHIASASDEARDQMAEIAANNVIDFLEGRSPRNAVKNI